MAGSPPRGGCEIPGAGLIVAAPGGRRSGGWKVFRGGGLRRGDGNDVLHVLGRKGFDAELAQEEGLSAILDQGSAVAGLPFGEVPGALGGGGVGIGGNRVPGQGELIPPGAEGGNSR